MFSGKRLSMLAMAAIAILAPSIASNASQGEVPQTEVRVDHSSVGTILARGAVSPDQEGCIFEDETLLSAEKADREHWYAVAVNESCDLILTNEWIGTLADAPPPIRETIGELVDAVTELEEAPEIVDAPDLRAAGFFGIQVLAAETCREHSQRVYTYGGGGPTLDKLTMVTSLAGICTNGSQAAIEYHSRTCTAWNPPGGWTWVTDSCTTSSINYGPASYVFKIDRGAFHCSPASSLPCNLSTPDGYFHTLYSRIRAWGSGTVICDFWKSGQVVFGPKRDILLGC